MFRHHPSHSFQFMSMGRPLSALPLLRIAAVVLACFAGLGVKNHPAIAAVPPYAEEWAIPAFPQDVEVDPWGRVWVSCTDDSIRVYTSTGGTLLFAFGGTGTGDGEFVNPYGMAFDAGGDVYICDYAGVRVEKFTSEGVFLLSWPIPSDRADHVAVDTAGDVYVTGFTDTAVHKYTSTGVPILDWLSANGSRTSGILEVGGTVHVVQWDVPIVEQFATDGTYLGSFATDALGGDDIEADASGQLWLADYFNNVVRLLSAAGDPLDILGEPGSGPGQFLGAIGVAAGPDGSIYVADESNSRVQRFGDPVVGVIDSEHPGELTGLALRAVSPNPCLTSAVLTYTVPHAQRLQITVTDIAGRTVATLANAPSAGGMHRIEWAARRDDGRRLAAGQYLIRLAGDSGVSTARVVVLE